MQVVSHANTYPFELSLQPGLRSPTLLSPILELNSRNPGYCVHTPGCDDPTA